MGMEIGEERRENHEWRGVWVFAEQRRGLVAEVVFELLGAGRALADKLGCELAAFALGSGIEKASVELIARGADVIYGIDDDRLEVASDKVRVDLAARLVRRHRPEVVLIGATSAGRSFGPRLAARLDTGLTADCLSLEVDPQRRIVLQTRCAFGGNLLATIACPERRPQMCTVLPRTMKPLPADRSRRGRIVLADEEVPADLSLRIINTARRLCREADLAKAEVIVAAGRGIGKGENMKIVNELAAVLGGVVGATRPVVEAGWTGPERQIGQTGRTVSPRLYIACGISGAVQHLAGITSADRIVAINRDPHAPIFKAAHLGIVGDVMEVVPALTRELTRRLLSGAEPSGFITPLPSR